jgi:alpha-1,3-mannosyltransferase
LFFSSAPLLALRGFEGMVTDEEEQIPPYVFPMLILSKRMHSIFVLRLFNDCFAVFFFFVAIYCYQKRWWVVGSTIYSIGLGVKMSLLLALPSVGIVLLQAIGARDAIGHASLIGLIQVCFSDIVLMVAY